MERSLQQKFGGRVAKSNKREYGRAILQKQTEDIIFKDLSATSQVWMSHGDTILNLPDGFQLLATTESIPVAAFKKMTKMQSHYMEFSFIRKFITLPKEKVADQFLGTSMWLQANWTPAHFITDTVAALKNQIGDRKVIMALSGGVDSTVAATLIHRAIGNNLYGIFVDNGVLRKNEFQNVLDTYAQLGLNVKGIDAKNKFYTKLAGVTEPEAKRKIIGSLFIDVFQEESKLIQGVELLGQGTIYPDVIESVSVHGPSVTIKSHHNVGGLPDHLHLELVEPFAFFV
jgi:GMP synthase (glutamine-hydrolysing)